MAKIREVFFAFLFVASFLLTGILPSTNISAYAEPLPPKILTKEDMKGFEKLTFYNTEENNIIGTEPEGTDIAPGDTYDFMKRHRLVAPNENGFIEADYGHIGQFHGRDISVKIFFSDFKKKPEESFGERDGRYVCVPLCFRDNFQYDGDSLVQKMVFFYSDDPSQTPIDMTNAFIVINGLNVDEYAGIREDHQVYLSENTQLKQKTGEGFNCFGNGPQGKSDNCINEINEDIKFSLNGVDYEEDISNPLYYVCSAMFTLKGTENEIYIEDRRKTGGYGIEWSLDLTTLHVTFNINTSVENGTITDPISGIIYNTDKTVKYSPSENYILDSITVDGTPVDISTASEAYEFKNITQDHEIHVVYKLPYKKIETEVINGIITPSDTNILFGTDKKIMYKAKEGYLLDDITVDNTPTDPDANKEQYLFENIIEDHQIKVVYMKPDAPVKRVLDKNGEFIDGKSVEAGDELTYEISYKNNLDKAAEITITDKIPEYTEFVSSSDGGVNKNGNIEWKISADPSTEGKVSMKVKLTSESKGKIISNYAFETIEGLNLMSNTVKNPVTGDPIKTVTDINGNDINGKFIGKDQELIYSISVKNTAAEEKSLKISDDVPEGMSFISVDNCGTENNGTVLWDIMIKPGEEKKVSFKAKTEKEGSSFINQAKVNLDGVSLLTNKVENWTLLSPVKEVKQNGQSADGREVANGETVDYTVTVKNTSSKPADIRVEDKLPDHIEVIKIDNGGSCEDGIITWTIKAVPAGETRVVGFAAKAKGAEDPVTVINKASMMIGDKRADSNEVSIKIPAVRRIEVLGEKLMPSAKNEVSSNQGVLGDRRIPTGDRSDIVALILLAMCAMAGIIIIRIKNA